MGFPSSHLARPGFSLVPVFHTTVCQLQSERNLLIRIKINNIMFSSLCLLASLASVQSYVLVPLYHPVSYIYPPPHLGHLGYLGQPASPLVHSPYIQISAPLQTQDISYSTVEKGLKFSPNRMLGENNMRLTWKGPYERHDAASALSPSNPTQ